MSNLTNLTLGLSWLALNVLAAGGALCYFMGWFPFTKHRARNQNVLRTLTVDDQKKQNDNFKPPEPAQQGY